MSLVYCEWRKLFHLPALWAFLGLCLVFNGLLIATQSPYDRAFFNDTSADAELLGQRVDGEFLAGLSAMPETETSIFMHAETESRRLSGRKNARLLWTICMQGQMK